MNRKKKLILVGILVIIYIVIAININKVKFAISMLDTYKNRNEISYYEDGNKEDNKEDIVDNPLLTIVKKSDNVDKDDTPVDNIEDSLDPPAINVEKPKNTDTLHSNPKDLESKSLDNIATVYNEKLEDLQAEFLNDLDNLISKGYEDYKSGETSTTKLASKYISQGSKLEKISDDKVNSILKEMEHELISNGYDTSLVKDVKAYYKSLKGSKKNSILNKALKYK